VTEELVVQLAEQAGFELVGRSPVNQNPRDTTDHPEGVWTLPPTLRLGDENRAQYLAIGESDRMTLLFIKRCYVLRGGDAPDACRCFSSAPLSAPRRVFPPVASVFHRCRGRVFLND